MLFTLRAEQSPFKFVPNKFSHQLKKVTKKSRRYAGRPVKSTGFPLLCCRHHAVKKLAEDAQTVFTESS